MNQPYVKRTDPRTGKVLNDFNHYPIRFPNLTRARRRQMIHGKKKHPGGYMQQVLCFYDADGKLLKLWQRGMAVSTEIRTIFHRPTPKATYVRTK